MYAATVATDLEYTGLKARAWDALRGDTSGWDDRGFYLELIGELGQPVLDVGCGTGRLLLDFLAQGIDIDGVELSPEMVAMLRAKAAGAGIDLAGRVHQAAMETMDLGRRYRVVLVPSSSFQLLVEPAAAAAAMERFHDHLEPGGTLVMPWIDLAQDYPGGAVVDDIREVGAARRIGDPGRVLGLVRSGDRAGAHRRAVRAADRRPGRGTGADRSLAGHPPLRSGGDPEPP